MVAFSPFWHDTRARLVSLFLVGLSLSLGGCADSSVRWRVLFECPSDARRTHELEVGIAEGDCEASGTAVYTETIVRGGVEPLDRPDSLPEGLYSFSATARDADGRRVAHNCVPVVLPRSSSIDIPLRGEGECFVEPPPPEEAPPEHALQDAAAPPGSSLPMEPDDGGVGQGADGSPPVTEQPPADPCERALAELRTDFEAGPEGWEHRPMDGAMLDGYTMDHWEWGAASGAGPGGCHTGEGCWATNLDDNYIQCQRAELVSPVMDLSACADADRDLQLVFHHYYDFWTGEHRDETWFDGGLVELSHDAGRVFAVPSGLAAEGTVRINPYIDSIVCLGSGFYADDKPGFTLASGGWKRVEVPIAPMFRTSTFRLRFVYATGVSYPDVDQATSMSNASPGWYVDDLGFE